MLTGLNSTISYASIKSPLYPPVKSPNVLLTHDALGSMISENCDRMSDSELSTLLFTSYGGRIDQTSYYKLFDNDHSVCITNPNYGVFCSIAYFEVVPKSNMESKVSRFWIISAHLRSQGNRFSLEHIEVRRYTDLSKPYLLQNK